MKIVGSAAIEWNASGIADLYHRVESIEESLRRIAKKLYELSQRLPPDN